jgi:hypothetical protein
MVARSVAKRIGRDYDAKRVRAWVRDNVDEYDDDGYTAHVYSAALAKRIEDALVKRAQGGGRPTAAAKGRAGTAKPRTVKAPTAPVTPDA